MQTYYNEPMFSKYPDVLTVKQLQEALNVGRSTAYKLVQSGEIPSFKIGTTMRIPKSGLISYLHGQLESCYNAICSDQTKLSCQKGVSDC